MCVIEVSILIYFVQDLGVKDLVREAHYKGEKVCTCLYSVCSVGVAVNIVMDYMYMHGHFTF